MYIGYSEEQEQLRRELRAYYDKLLTPEVEEGLARRHGIGPVNREGVRQLGRDGWLGIRTDPEAKKQKGISMFIVPMDTPGIKLMPMDLMSDHDINQVFYDDVRVPASALVGGENNGWGLITNQLNRERVTLCSSGIIERALTGTRRWAQDARPADGRAVIGQAWE